MTTCLEPLTSFDQCSMSVESRRHLEGYIALASTAYSHQRCMENLQYCYGYIGALTIEHRCTLEEHQEVWRRLDVIRDNSIMLKNSGRRS